MKKIYSQFVILIIYESLRRLQYFHFLIQNIFILINSRRQEVYFQLSETDNYNIQAIKSKWRFHNNSLHGQPQLKIDFEEQPQKSFQLPDVFMTTRQNQPKVQHHHTVALYFLYDLKLEMDNQWKDYQNQSYDLIPKKSRKGSKISLSSLEVSPKIPILNKSKEQKFKELSDLQKSYSQYKKSFHKVKNQQQTQLLNTSAYFQQESSFVFNGVKLQLNKKYKSTLPYSLYTQ